MRSGGCQWLDLILKGSQSSRRAIGKKWPWMQNASCRSGDATAGTNDSVVRTYTRRYIQQHTDRPTYAHTCVIVYVRTNGYLGFPGALRIGGSYVSFGEEFAADAMKERLPSVAAIVSMLCLGAVQNACNSWPGTFEIRC